MTRVHGEKFASLRVASLSNCHRHSPTVKRKNIQTERVKRNEVGISRDIKRQAEKDIECDRKGEWGIETEKEIQRERGRSAEGRIHYT